ncbi:hypothetical protein [Bradyrhizobium sp. UFLA05-112]
MTDQKPSQQLTTQQRAAIGKTKAGGVSGRLKAACDDMVWNGTPWEEAATKANLTVRAMRLAMKRPQVLAYLKAERGVVLAQLTLQNPRRLAELRDQNENRAAAVQAARALEAISEADGPRGDSPNDRPGVVIQIIGAAPAGAPGVSIDVTPNKNLSTGERMDAGDDE